MPDSARPDDTLFARAQAGDRAAREALAERFLPLARQLARRYQRADEPLDDLVQVASLGMLKAIDRFDASRGIAFSSYAVPTILGELKRHFRDRTGRCGFRATSRSWRCASTGRSASCVATCAGRRR